MKDTDLDYMVYSLLKEVNKRSNLDPKLVEDVTMGNVSTTFQQCRQKLMGII